MNQRTLTAFIEELANLSKEASMTKEAFPPLGEIASRFAKPMMGAVQWGRDLAGHPNELFSRMKSGLGPALKEGWNDWAPTAKITREAKKLNFSTPAEALRGLDASHPMVQQTMKAKGITADQAVQHHLKEMMGSGLTGRHQTYMAEPNVPLRHAYRQGGVKGLAEQLSRSGWTGETKYTKYLPVGGKAMIPGMTAMAIPGIVNAKPASPTGEGGRLEKVLGEVGSTAGMVLTGGMGILPGTIGWGLAQKAGTRAGRVLDRLRSGATVNQALHAPSPTEAAAQLENIRKNYGG
jgi:hypothetical protein